MHSPNVSHHRLLRRGVEQAVHKKTIHPINKYGNTSDAISENKGGAVTTSYRMKNSGVIVIAFLIWAIIYSNMK